MHNTVCTWTDLTESIHPISLYVMQPFIRNSSSAPSLVSETNKKAFQKTRPATTALAPFERLSFCKFTNLFCILCAFKGHQEWPWNICSFVQVAWIFKAHLKLYILWMHFHTFKMSPAKERKCWNCLHLLII